jgi:hypothetical protein
MRSTKPAVLGEERYEGLRMSQPTAEIMMLWLSAAEFQDALLRWLRLGSAKKSLLSMTVQYLAVMQAKKLA